MSEYRKNIPPLRIIFHVLEMEYFEAVKKHNCRLKKKFLKRIWILYSTQANLIKLIIQIKEQAGANVMFSKRISLATVVILSFIYDNI